MHLSLHKNGETVAVPVLKENSIAGLGGLEIPYLPELHFWDHFTLQAGRSGFIVKHFEEKYIIDGKREKAL